MPAEPMTLLLRPRNFFVRNPALDVPPSYCSTPSMIAAGKKEKEVWDKTDSESKLVVVGASGGICCAK